MGTPRINRSDVVRTVTDRVLLELRSDNPPGSVPDLAQRIGANLRTVKWVLQKEVNAGTLTRDSLPWNSGRVEAARHADAVAQYREENTRLREENAKLLAAHGLAAKSQEENLAPHLQQIFRAAGKDLCERVMQIVWPPSAILTAQEASDEAEVVAASPPS